MNTPVRRSTYVIALIALTLVTGVAAAQGLCPCIRGTVLDGNGNGRSGLTVRLLDADGKLVGDAAVTVAAGSFTLQNVPVSVLEDIARRPHQLELLDGDATRATVFVTRDTIASVGEGRVTGLFGFRRLVLELFLRPIYLRN